MIRIPGMRTYSHVIYDETSARERDSSMPRLDQFVLTNDCQIVCSVESIRHGDGYSFTVGNVNHAWTSGSQLWANYTMLPDWHFEGRGYVTPYPQADPSGGGRLFVALYALGLTRIHREAPGNIESRYRIG